MGMTLPTGCICNITDATWSLYQAGGTLLHRLACIELLEQV
jgi:hypothetical protein